jgi:hypothetical protein
LIGFIALDCRPTLRRTSTFFSRRLAQKLRALQVLLDDPDLHEIALDEESADDPVDYDIDPQDLIDLIEQLEGRAVFDEDQAD